MSLPPGFKCDCLLPKGSRLANSQMIQLVRVALAAVFRQGDAAFLDAIKEIYCGEALFCRQVASFNLLSPLQAVNQAVSNMTQMTQPGPVPPPQLLCSWRKLEGTRVVEVCDGECLKAGHYTCHHAGGGAKYFRWEVHRLWHSFADSAHIYIYIGAAASRDRKAHVAVLAGQKKPGHHLDFGLETG